MRARFVVLVVGVLGVSASAAPVPKGLKKVSPVVLAVSRDADDADALRVTLTNNTAADISWQSTTIPLAAFPVHIADGKGHPLDSVHPCVVCSPFSPPGKAYTVKPGESYVMRFGLTNCFPNGKRPAGTLAVTVAFTHAGETYRSQPLEVK
jgi:hypothetical protein